MSEAINQAQLAANRGEVPVGAVLVLNNKILALDGNRTLEMKDPTAHAEILVIRKASQLLDSERLNGADLYVTLEPCPMCAAAISFSRIRRLYFGAGDPKSGGVENGVRYFNDPTCHHQPEVYSGIQEDQCAQILKKFFQTRRD